MKEMIQSLFCGYLLVVLISGCKGDIGPAGTTGATGRLEQPEQQTLPIPIGFVSFV